MLYLIGLGLNVDGITKEGIESIRKCKKIYLENYTVNFPYNKRDLEKVIKKKIILSNREFIENFKFLNESKKINVALLVYGNPLIATTHISIIQKIEELKIKYKIIHNTSVLDAVSETGLQIYKFGKITSLPKWDEKNNFIPTSFIKIIKENMSINAHTLILVDINLNFKEAINEISISSEKENLILNEKILVCQSIGTKNSKIIYKNIYEFKKIDKLKRPYCIIIPSKLHFAEEEFLKKFL